MSVPGFNGDGAMDRVAQLAPALQSDLAAFRDAVEASTSPEDAIERVTRLLKTWRPEASAREVEVGLQIAAAEGAVHGKV